MIRIPFKSREMRLKKQKEWYKENKEECLKKSKKYHIDHPEYLEQYRSSAKGKYAVYKAKAKSKGFIFKLTFDEFSNILNKPCYYCGKDGFGIDRLDSLIGYLKDNIVSCCSMCNWMKNTYAKDDFIKQCIKISNKWGDD